MNTKYIIHGQVEANQIVIDSKLKKKIINRHKTIKKDRIFDGKSTYWPDKGIKANIKKVP